MLYASVVMPKRFGASLTAVDDSAARVVPAVRRIVRGTNFVGVIAGSWWQARTAALALRPRWEGGADISSTAISARLDDTLKGEQIVRKQLGDAEAILSTSDSVVEAQYSAPFQTHAFLEPRNATALFRDGGFEFWGSTQSAIMFVWAAEQAAELTGRSLDRDTVTHVMDTGGGFGGRSERVEAVQTALLALAVPGTAVKLIWGREQDTQHGVYRTPAKARLRASLGTDGLPDSLSARVAAVSLHASFGERNLPTGAGNADEDHFTIEGLPGPYTFANVTIEAQHIWPGIPIGFCRANGYGYNTFFLESFLDECADAAGRDPLDYRIALTADDRARRVLTELRARSGWGRLLPSGSGMGCAMTDSYASYLAVAATVSNVTVEHVSIDEIVAVFDCGRVVNPDVVRAQIEGGLTWGLSQGLLSAITLDGGAVNEDYFSTYEVLRLSNSPKNIRVILLDSDADPGGAGEPGVPPAAPAVANAIARAGGGRLRDMPILRANSSHE